MCAMPSSAGRCGMWLQQWRSPDLPCTDNQLDQRIQAPSMWCEAGGLKPLLSSSCMGWYPPAQQVMLHLLCRSCSLRTASGCYRWGMMDTSTSMMCFKSTCPVKSLHWRLQRCKALSWQCRVMGRCWLHLCASQARPSPPSCCTQV